MKRLIPYAAYLYLIAIHQELTSSLLAVHEVHVNLTALIVSLVALYKDDYEAMWFGFAAGIVFSAGTAPWIGWYALVLSLIAVVISRVKFRLNMDSVYARLLVVAGAVLAHEILLTVQLGQAEFYWKLLTVALPSTVYTSLWAWLFFKIKDGKITWARVKELF